MTGTTPKCLMMVQNKGQDEGEVVHPENFGKDFYSNNIFDKAQVTLYEISKIPQNDDDEFEDYDEGGEDENEEMEEELEEQEQQIEVEPVAVQEEPPKEIEDQKASEVLFDNEDENQKPSVPAQNQ